MSRSVRLMLGLLIMCAIGYIATISQPASQQNKRTETQNKGNSHSPAPQPEVPSPAATQAPLSILYNIGDHRYAICHRHNSRQVSRHDIEDLMLVLEPANIGLIQRQGDPLPASSPNTLPSGWVMLLDHNDQLQLALERLDKVFDLSEQ